MPEYSAFFQEKTRRVDKAFVVIDINNSTRMKQIEAEQSWVNKTLHLYGIIAHHIEHSQGKVVKFVGDGILAMFDEDNAVSAINAAIRIQEALKEQREKGITDTSVSASVTYGSAVEFEILTETDYIGQTVDRAYRLCSAANANAVFIDSQIIDAAPMTKVSSVVGEALRRGSDQYRGAIQQVTLKGFSSPVSYHEIWWDRDRYGVDPKFVSDQSTDKASAATSPARSQTLQVESRTVDGQVWGRGYVKSITDKYGFITSGSEDFFFAPWFSFSDDFVIEKGSQVVFAIEGARKDGQNRAAKKIFLIDANVRGKVLKRVPNSNYGFVDIEGKDNAHHRLFVVFRDMEVSEGELIECSIHANEKGPVGMNPRKLQIEATSDFRDIPELDSEQ